MANNPYLINDGPRAQQQQQISPQQIMQGLNIAKQFGAFGGSGSGTAAASTGSTAGTGAASSGVGSAVSSIGPWAALAAVIYANESYASAHGDRPEDSGEYAKDLLTGDVFYQDVEKRFLPNIGIYEGSKESEFISSTLNPMPLDIGKQWEGLKGLFG